MALRPAGPDDLDDICTLIRDLAAYEHLEAEVELDSDEVGRNLFGESPTASVVLAVDDDTAEIAGFALYFPTFSTFVGRAGIWLEDLFVRPEHRGRGHGLALLQHLRGLTDGRIEWAVLDWNQPAIEFYLSIGAEPIDGWTKYRWLPAS